jgi:hypothetical protein
MPTKRLASSSRKKASFCQSKTTVLRTVSSGESFGTEIHEEQRTENRREDNNMKPLLNVKQAAELCGISPWTVRSYIKQGKLLPVHIGRRVLIHQPWLKKVSSTTFLGTVEKIIKSPFPGEPEKVQIAVEGADPLYKEVRVENKLTDKNGAEVRLKERAKVEVTVEAKPEDTSAKTEDRRS